MVNLRLVQIILLLVVPISGASATSYIVTNSTGALLQSVAASSSKTFPVGTASAYAPVTVANQDGTNADGYSALVASATAGSNSGADRVQLQWTVGRSGATVYAATFQWPGTAEGTNFAANRATYDQLYDISNPTTNLYSSSNLTGDPYTVTSVNTLNTNTSYAIGNGASALPVELTSFTATGTHNGAMLVWKTATEKNNYGFNIERRVVNSQTSPPYQGGDVRGGWSKVGFVAGHGTSNSANSYSYADANVSAGTYAYRIAQIDNDGTVKTYNESEVTVGAAAKILSLCNYPNPFNPTTTVEFTVPTDGMTTVKIYNILGQEVVTAFRGDVKAGQYQHATFDGSKLSSGVYFYSIENNGQRMVKKMLMMK